MRDYKIVASEPYCCVTAILESILLKHGYVFNQVMIADYFGLTVPADEYAQLSKTFKNLKVSDEELAKRKANWKPREAKVTTGYLARYAKLVSSASTGAVFK